MRAGSHRRQVLLFFVAMLVPCLLLLVFSVRMMQQDADLAEKRRQDAQAGLLAEANRELLAQLESTKAREMAALREAAGHASRAVEPDVVFAAWVHEKRPVLPWDAARPDLFGKTEVSRRVAEAEQQEFAGGQLEAAVGSYEEALKLARTPAQAAYIGYLRARALEGTPRRGVGLPELRRLLDAPIEAVDEDGIPVRLLAAERLLGAVRDWKAALGAVQATVEARPVLSGAAHYRALEVAQAVVKLSAGEESGAAARALATRVEEQVRDIRQAARLQAEFSGWHVPAGKVLWRVFPEAVREDESDSWLVSTATEHSRTAMVVLRTVSVLSKFEARFKRPKARIRLVVSRSEEGQPLGAAFEGVRAEVTLAPDNPLLTRTKLQSLFYLALVLAAGGTMFGAYLLWRDFEREFRMADLQSQFVASVSHELKTPLTAIRMFAETMQMGRARGRETEAEYLETIVSECERLSRLVDDVLQFSKMERGHKVYRIKPVDLASVVDSACRAIQYPVREQGVDLRTSIAEEMPPVRGDRDALEQALLNLLSNALKYSGNSRLIEVELEREGREAAIRVTDHGVGIRAEEQERIFERFYRVQTPENQRIPGTGIGLALVAQSAKAHGGRVEVRSAPGQGSTFSIYLPLEGADEHDSGS